MKNRRGARLVLTLDGVVQCLIVDNAALDTWGRCDLILRSPARLILGGAAVYRCDNDLATDRLLAAAAAQRRGKNPGKNYKLKSGSLKT
jgi:hypothetical protein